MRNCANVAATLHEHLCEHDWHGYDWGDRWGDGEGVCPVEVDGEMFEVQQGDRDCSSSVIECWQQAIKGTEYEGSLDGATYTGNMRSVFTNSGLFEWWPMSMSAVRGDIYLNEANHTAMCQCGDADNDILSEFSINENGGCYGGQVGDQTGWESHICGYYDYPWDGILHYNGSADSTNSISERVAPRYRVYTREHGWHDYMNGLVDEGGSEDDFAGAQGCWIYGFDIDCDYRIVRCDGSESINSQGNMDSAICGIEIMEDVEYQVHWLGDEPAWGKWEHGSDDNGAGKDCDSPLDMVRVK